MGASVTQALVNAIGGKGKVVMTQGALGHTGAQGRAKGFEAVVKQYPNIEVLDTQPADWDVTKTARLWETYLTKYPQIDAAFFHNDDMALAAYNVMKARNRTEHPDRRRRRHAAGDRSRRRTAACSPPCAIRPAASMAAPSSPAWRRSPAARRPAPAFPKSIVTDGPVVTKDNAAGMLWMEDHFLI